MLHYSGVNFGTETVTGYFFLHKTWKKRKGEASEAKASKVYRKFLVWLENISSYFSYSH